MFAFAHFVYFWLARLINHKNLRRLTTGLASVTNLAQSTDIHTSYLRVAGLVTWASWQQVGSEYDVVQC